MKLKLFLSILIVFTIFIITGCDFKKNIENSKQSKEKIINNKEMKTMKIAIDNNEYTIDLEDNETVNSFINLLPKKFEMKELNGNEKYVNLDTELPVKSYYPKKINSGDVMLFGNNCLVIFYKTFDTHYSYTKIGHIKNLPDLGNKNIQVVIEKQK